MAKKKKKTQKRGIHNQTSEFDFEKMIKTVNERVSSAYDSIRERILNDKPNNDHDIADGVAVSREQLQKYATLHLDHFKGIMNTKIEIERYKEDKTLKRPLNIILQAPAGSGKSHFVKCLAAAIDRMKVINFNMTGVNGVDDLAVPLEYARNVKIDDKLPLLFLDEFDVTPKNYGILLPLLWDGELKVGSHILRLGKAVIILAGSSEELAKAIKAGKNIQEENPYNGEKENSKLPDLLSRINGPQLNIPPLDDKTPGNERCVDKVCIAVSLLLGRFPHLEIVPWALLHYIGKTKFRHGVRSISNLIDLIDNIGSQKELTLGSVRFPLTDADRLESSNLSRHLQHQHGFESLVKNWRKACKVNVGIRITPMPIKEDYDVMMENFDKMQKC